MGSITNPGAPPQGDKTAVKRAANKKDCVPAANPVDSVFLAKNGRDKRLPDEEQIHNGKIKISRWQGRRSAITGMGQSKLQVRTAVKIHTARHPDRMRRVHKACEAMSGRGKIQVNLRHLDDNQLESLMEQTGMQEEDVNNLYDSFTRYDIDDSGYLDRNEARQVLCDLGLQAHGCEEKVEVHEIICDADTNGLRHYSFQEFVPMVKAVRERLRQIQSVECMMVYEDADKDGNQHLDMEEVFQIMDRRLHMIARTEEERHEMASMFHYCDHDYDGQHNFEEFQEFVQRSRAKLMTMRREEEITIAKAFLLPPDVVAEFRMDLPLLWAIFNRHDRHVDSHHGHGDSKISRADLVGLLIDIGACPARPQPGCQKMKATEMVLDYYARDETDFPLFLKMVHELRIKGKEVMLDELKERFNFYDKQKDSELCYTEVYQILADFKMLPRSREEQQGIFVVIERLDTDGSGSFNFQEFHNFFQRLTEQVQTTEREAERQMVLGMGFTESQLQALRSVFFSLGPNMLGKIPQIGLVSAVNRTRDILCPGGMEEQSVREITRNAQHAPERGITFQEFSRSLKMVMTKKDDDQTGPVDEI